MRDACRADFIISGTGAVHAANPSRQNGSLMISANGGKENHRYSYEGQQREAERTPKRKNQILSLTHRFEQILLSWFATKSMKHRPPRNLPPPVTLTLLSIH